MATTAILTPQPRDGDVQPKKNTTCWCMSSSRVSSHLSRVCPALRECLMSLIKKTNRILQPNIRCSLSFINDRALGQFWNFIMFDKSYVSVLLEITSFNKCFFFSFFPFSTICTHHMKERSSPVWWTQQDPRLVCSSIVTNPCHISQITSFHNDSLGFGEVTSSTWLGRPTKSTCMILWVNVLNVY